MNTNFDYNPTPNSQPIFNFNEQIKSIFTEIFAFFGTVNKQGYLLNLSGNILEKTNLNAKLLIGQKFSETVFWQSSEHTSRILDQAIEEAAMGKPVKSLLNFRISSDNKLIIASLSFAGKRAGNLFLRL
jgi:hypothetical protein